MLAPVELEPDAPVVPEDGQPIPATEIRPTGGSDDARTGAAVESGKKFRHFIVNFIIS